MRRESPRVVFVLGCEMSLFNRGFVPGATYMERIETMMNPALPGSISESPETMQQRFNAFLQHAVAVVRKQFAGPITYASGTWEDVDWNAFDIAGVDPGPPSGHRSRHRPRGAIVDRRWLVAAFQRRCLGSALIARAELTHDLGAATAGVVDPLAFASTLVYSAPMMPLMCRMPK